MKRGDYVAVCYDGKWGRRVRGEVIATRKGSRILVRFPEWANEDNILEHWFPVRRLKTRFGGPRKNYAGFVPVEKSIMRGLFGMPGDWYCVWPWDMPDRRPNRETRKFLFEYRIEHEKKELFDTIKNSEAPTTTAADVTAALRSIVG